MDVRRPVQVTHGDDRRHHAATVSEALEELERLLEERRGLVDDRRDGELGQHLFEHLSGGHALTDRDVRTELHLFHEPRSNPAELDDAGFAQRRSQGRIVAELPREFARAPERLVRAVQVHLAFDGGEGLSRGRVHEVLSELHARGHLGAPILALHGELADLAGQLRGPVVLLGGAERRGPAQAHVELEVRVTERLRECGELGEALQSIARTSQHVERAVARLQQVQALLRGRGGGQRELDDAQHLFGGVRGQRVPARLDREAHAHGRIARGLRVVREEREALGGRLTREQEFDDRGVDRLPPRLGQRAGREIADLLVLEAVVGGRLLGVLGEQPRRHRGRERERQRGGLGLERPIVHAELDLAQVLQAEVATEHGGIREQFLRLVRQVGCPARDEGLHRGRNQTFRVAGQPPDAVDLLDHRTVAVRARHLLDDERHALGLRMHHGGAAGVDRAAEDRRDEILVSDCVKRSTFIRRSKPIRSMSAIRFTASVTSASSSGRIASIRKIGLVASERMT